jgi:TolA-binding protein
LDKELKKQIKADEFKSAVEHTLEWGRSHSAEVRVTALVALVLAGVLGAVGYFQASQRRQAEEGFGEAIATLNLPVLTATDPSPAPGTPVFTSAKEKHTAAVAAFDGLARKFSSRPEGLRARYLAALSRIEIGQFSEAEQALSEIAVDRRAGALEPALARLALAELYRRSGQVDKATDGFRQIASDPGSAVPRAAALMGLAETLEDARRLPEAQATFRRVFEEFPRSVYASEARRRAERLGSVVEG